TSSDTEGSKCVEERPKWNNKAEYLLTCIGFAVGLGNVWRFPYLCQIYGGGAFLIPYFIALVFQGLPLLYLELAIGQRLRTGSIGVWNSISPYLGGVGIASLVVSFCVSLFYNTIVAWVLWYLFNSFQEPLPWSQCPLNINNTGFEEECVESTPVNYFWYRETLNISPNIETSGSLQWWLVVCLATAWCIVYICFIRGIETIGKAVYVTATFPYLVLTIFLVRALILPGATDGLKHLFTPKWDILLNPQVWLDAATQIFFSLSLAFGGLISFSSYNHQKNDCERDAIVVGVINSATSIYASIPIFAILGFKAHTNFVTCLNDNILALTNDFEISDMNITIDNYDQWFDYLNTTHTEKVSNLHLKTCNMQDFLDQVIHPGIFNGYVGSVPLLIIAFFETIAVVYVYGIRRFSDDLEFMTGRRPNIFWKVCWLVISPLMLLVVLVAYVAVQIQTNPTYPAWNPKYEKFPNTEVQPYPDWVFAICVLLSSVPVMSIPMVAIYRLICRLAGRRSTSSSPELPNLYDNEGYIVDS
uniref:Transporter n=1 Tax=Esox lucius TaxID=8010 RepID=A0A6Q2ZFF1_ESOLU